ncbi:MAG TPA: hypothetical protein VI357_25400 [Mycobacteriales bacterium]
MRLFPGEPAFRSWRAEAIPSVLARVRPGPGTRIVAVDGRSAGGKTTCATRLAAIVPGATVVHTDDVALHQSFFDWAFLLRAGVLDPVRAGRAVAYRPPAWESCGRDGAIEVPAGCPLLVVEGVGVSRRDLSGQFDLRLWVQSDRVEAHRRGIERDGGPSHEAFWQEWEAEEKPFLAADRPWERADLIIAGGPELPYDPATAVLVADPKMDR